MWKQRTFLLMSDQHSSFRQSNFACLHGQVSSASTSSVNEVPHSYDTSYVWSEVEFPDGITYARQVAEITHVKQVLDGEWFNMDEISVTLQLFYFQTQDDLVYKKVTPTIEDLVRPMTDASHINHKLLTTTIIRTFNEYGDTTTTKTFKVATTGSVQPNPGCKG
jgi:hypothetical protein